MRVNLKVLCILLLCIILADTSKASENLTFVWNQNFTLRAFMLLLRHFGSVPWRSNNQWNRWRYYLKIGKWLRKKWPLVDLASLSFIVFPQMFMWKKTEVLQDEVVSQATYHWITFHAFWTRVEKQATNTRIHFKECPKVVKSSWLYPSLRTSQC